MLEGRKLLKKGLVWRIGDGRNVEVWGAPWLVDGENARIQSTMGSHNMDMTVAELTREGRMEWDLERVDLIFNPDEARQIVELLLRRTGGCINWCGGGQRM